MCEISPFRCALVRTFAALACLLPWSRVAAQAPSSAEAVELRVTSRACEQPLLKYRLFPAEYELREGNAAPILLRLPWEQSNYFATVVPTFEQFLKLKLDDPKLLEAGPVLASGFYGELKRAAHRRSADWEYPIGESPLAYVLLPDIQGAREIVGRGLSVWIRYRIARGELDQAQEGIRIGLSVSRHYARTPFIITQLVCVAIDGLMLQRVEELLSASDCPNLYWALTALPRPLKDLRPAAELQEKFLEMSVGGSVADGLAVKDWEQQLRDVMKLYSDTSGLPPASDADLRQLRARILKQAREGLPPLTEGGAEKVAAMSDAEATVRWLVSQHLRHSQAFAARIMLPPPVAITELRDLQEEMADFREQSGLGSLFVMEKPLNIYLSVQGLQRRIDALRVVEAIRNYAATNGGQLPATLNDIDSIPVPSDLLTGKPFEYSMSNNVATLSAPGIPIDSSERAAIHYRISLR